MTSLRRAVGLTALAAGLTYASHAAATVAFTWITMRKYRGSGFAGARVRDHLPPYLYHVRKAPGLPATLELSPVVPHHTTEENPVSDHNPYKNVTESQLSSASWAAADAAVDKLTGPLLELSVGQYDRLRIRLADAIEKELRAVRRGE